MIKKLLLPLALLMGIVWDVLFWEKAPGVSFPLFIVVCLAGAIFLLRSEGVRPAKSSIFLMVGVVFARGVYVYPQRPTD